MSCFIVLLPLHHHHLLFHHLHLYGHRHHRHFCHFHSAVERHSFPLQSCHLGTKTPPSSLFLRLSLLVSTISKILILWKRLGPAPIVSRIPSVSVALDPEGPASRGSASITAGSTIVGGSDNKPEGNSGNDERTQGSFESFGGKNGGRPFVEILAELRTLLHHKLRKSNQSDIFS